MIKTFYLVCDLESLSEIQTESLRPVGKNMKCHLYIGLNNIIYKIF